MVDRLLLYPMTPSQGTRGGPKDTPGTPVEAVGSVQADSMTSNPTRPQLQGGQRYGKITATILLAEAPTLAIAAGWKIEHIGKVGKYGGDPITFARLEKYVATATPIPPGAGRNRWTLTVERDD